MGLLCAKNCGKCTSRHLFLYAVDCKKPPSLEKINSLLETVIKLLLETNIYFGILESMHFRVLFIRQYFSDLSNGGFKLYMNKSELIWHGIINQNTFRCSGWVDKTAIRRRDYKCNYLFVFKGTEQEKQLFFSKT